MTLKTSHRRVEMKEEKRQSTKLRAVNLQCAMRPSAVITDQTSILNKSYYATILSPRFYRQLATKMTHSYVQMAPKKVLIFKFGCYENCLNLVLTQS